MENVILTIIWAAVIQGLLLGILFIFSKKHKSRANRILGFFLLAFVFEALSALLPFDSIGNYSLEGYFTLPEVKLFFPLLFIHFVLENVGGTKQYWLFLRSHYFIAFIVIGVTFVNVILFIFTGFSIHDHFEWNTIESVYQTQQYYSFMLMIFGFVITIRATLRYRDLVRNEYTDPDMLEIKWLWQFILLIVPAALLWGVELFRIAFGGRGQSDFVIVTWVFVAILNYFISYKAFTHQNLFEGTLKSSDEDGKTFSDERSDPEACAEIRQTMEQQQYYLNQELTLHDFAKEINVSSRLISNCINRNMGLNFNEWVNNYRVDRAMEIFTDNSKPNFTIEGIGAECGFKSRSAMYTAFKKKTGFTPGHFRQD